MSTPPDKLRFAQGGAAVDHTYVYQWRLTDPKFADAVRLVIPPSHVLPVVFVPGIMGSNLRMNSDHKTQVWRLDHGGWLVNWGPMKGQPLGLVWDMKSATPGDRQKLMHPARTEVDPSGHVPSKATGSIGNPNDYTRRGWGEIGEGSYHEFLLWLEKRLNGQGYNPARWSDFNYTAISAAPKPGERPPEPRLFPGIPMNMPGLPASAEINAVGGMPPPVTSDDLIKRAGFRMPVYACGYNWLASNTEAAKTLQARIDKIISENSNAHSQCSQVIVVTHSMGGLVARACQKLPGMRDKIAGIVHGVMPSVGAAVAYRRCKIGMRDEDSMAGMVIGQTGQDVTAVFAQAPGALQLLPTNQYRTHWLSFEDRSGSKLAAMQPANGDPYKDIYLVRNRWWGLIREEWLHPGGGSPIIWDDYQKNMMKTKQFHADLQGAFHFNTYVYYGKDAKQESFEGVHWKVVAGLQPDHKPHPTAAQVPNLGFDQVRDDGSNPLHVGGSQEYAPSYSPFSVGTTYETAYWDLQCAVQDGGGDGTVPCSSGAMPRSLGGSSIKQQFGLTGFKHEGSYRDSTAQIVTLYALQKIAATAKVPA